RSAAVLARTTEKLRTVALAPTPSARQTQADAADGSAASSKAAAAIAANVDFIVFIFSSSQHAPVRSYALRPIRSRSLHAACWSRRCPEPPAKVMDTKHHFDHWTC